MAILLNTFFDPNSNREQICKKGASVLKKQLKEQRNAFHFNLRVRVLQISSVVVKLYTFNGISVIKTDPLHASAWLSFVPPYLPTYLPTKVSR